MPKEGTAAELQGSQSAPWTVKRVLEWTIGYLKEHGSDSPRLDAEVLLAHVRNCPRIKLYTDYETPLSEAERSRMRELVKRRAAAEPVAYLVGYREFFSLRFLVSRDVLVPRPDTESLVLAALDLARTVSHPPAILDLCTGSGCVAVALAKNLPLARIAAVEISPGAAQVARANIEQHQVSDRVSVFEGNLYSPLPPNDRFDLIVSNPPYIPTAEISKLEADVRQHEPHLALDGGADGLDVIRRLVEDASRFLKSNGWILFEIAPEQMESALNLMASAGFVNRQFRKDMAGQIRIVMGKLS